MNFNNIMENNMNLFKPTQESINAKRQELELQIISKYEPIALNFLWKSNANNLQNAQSSVNIEYQVNKMLEEWIVQSTRDAMNFQLN